MHCSVKSCSTCDDRFLWKCEFCSKHYHAACVGVQRHQENFISSYMIPLCADCQHHLKTGIDTRKALCQQEQLFESIKSLTDANLSIASDMKKLNAIGELFENIELQLKELMTNVNKNTSSKVENAVSSLSRNIESNSFNNVDEVVSIKNHLTSLFNISMETTRKRIEEHVNDLTTDLSRELKAICGEVQNLSSLTIDMAAHCNEHNTSESQPTKILEEMKSLTNAAAEDILNEIKTLGSVVTTLDSSVTNARLLSAASPSSLMDELADQSSVLNLRHSHDNRQRVVDQSGWRLLGTRKVWKADWTAYDKRKLHRLNQQKQADKAKKRKKNRRIAILTRPTLAIT